MENVTSRFELWSKWQESGPLPVQPPTPTQHPAFFSEDALKEVPQSSQRDALLALPIGPEWGVCLLAVLFYLVTFMHMSSEFMLPQYLSLAPGDSLQILEDSICHPS